MASACDGTQQGIAWSHPCARQHLCDKRTSLLVCQTKGERQAQHMLAPSRTLAGHTQAHAGTSMLSKLGWVYLMRCYRGTRVGNSFRKEADMHPSASVRAAAHTNTYTHARTSSMDTSSVGGTVDRPCRTPAAGSTRESTKVGSTAGSLPAQRKKGGLLKVEVDNGQEGLHLCLTFLLKSNNAGEEQAGCSWQVVAAQETVVEICVREHVLCVWQPHLCS
eukprot:scaffold85075_cov17-Tisochrysis_lutea.AAC.2